MTDKYTELFLFCYISYIHKYIYIKMFTIRFLLFFFHFEWLSEWRLGNPEILQEGINAICL